MRPRRGFIKLYRSTTEHWSWHRGPFSMGQFWAHLLLSANYHESTVRRGLRTITVKRGQLLTSIEKLSPTLLRDRKTIRAWLRAFASDGMLDIETDHGGDGGYTLLTIRNYEKYQGSDPTGPDDGLDDALPDALPDAVDDGLPFGLDDGLDPSKKLKKLKQRKKLEETNKNGGRAAFDQFWARYPKKQAPDDALAVWLGGKTKAGRLIPSLDVVLAALERAKVSHDWTKDHGQYIPMPATWLRQGRWLDEPRPNGYDPRRVNDAWRDADGEGAIATGEAGSRDPRGEAKSMGGLSPTPRGLVLQAPVYPIDPGFRG